MVGAIRVMPLMAMALRAMALVSIPRSTSCGIIACRAGIMKEKTAPCIMEAASKWYQVTTSSEMETATKRAISAAPACPHWIMRLRSNLSAKAPPKRDNNSMGRAKPAETMPSRAGEPVSS